MSRLASPWTGEYSRWRHGGWYVTNVRYDSGAVGCVSNNYVDKRWRVVCNSDDFEDQPSFSSREDAAQAERLFVKIDRLEKQLALLQRKVAHGCTDASCSACDSEPKPGENL